MSDSNSNTMLPTSIEDRRVSLPAPTSNTMLPTGVDDHRTSQPTTLEEIIRDALERISTNHDTVIDTKEAVAYLLARHPEVIRQLTQDRGSNYTDENFWTLVAVDHGINPRAAQEAWNRNESKPWKIAEVSFTDIMNQPALPLRGAQAVDVGHHRS